MIINGWLDWAIKLPSYKNTYEGTNQARGIFFHSAEGYRQTLLSNTSPYGFNGNHSWHFTNMLRGDFYQHHPITDRCWHASAANFDYLGMENEGIGDPKKGRPDPTLSIPQVNNAVRLIREISAYKGWEPTRPWSSTSIDHTLWEHNEVVRIGGTASACPSGRIPWEEIRMRLTAMPSDNDQILALLALAHFIRNGWNLNDLSDFDIAAIEAAVERMRQANA